MIGTLDLTGVPEESCERLKTANAPPWELRELLQHILIEIVFPFLYSYQDRFENQNK